MDLTGTLIFRLGDRSCFFKVSGHGLVKCVPVSQVHAFFLCTCRWSFYRIWYDHRKIEKASVPKIKGPMVGKAADSYADNSAFDLRSSHRDLLDSKAKKGSLKYVLQNITRATNKRAKV